MSAPKRSCACGCGQTLGTRFIVADGRRYVFGHQPARAPETVPPPAKRMVVR